LSCSIILLLACLGIPYPLYPVISVILGGCSVSPTFAVRLSAFRLVFLPARHFQATPVLQRPPSPVVAR